MKKLGFFFTFLLFATVCLVWLGRDRGVKNPVAVRIIGRAFDASDNYKVTFEVTNSAAQALAIFCYSLGESGGPYRLSPHSAQTFTLLDEGLQGRVNGPVRIRYTKSYGALKEAVDNLSWMLNSPFHVIKWKEAVTPEATAPDHPAPGKADPAPLLVVGHQWPGLREPGRQPTRK